ncbi:hypothetical protein [Stenotrophomonas sp. NPDC077659]|uniref:hypothetical protein n=1 Tax=Stenotrophomonas sp. NPDC077659 TaxID=3390694 RepID=UPI003CFE50D7
MRWSVNDTADGSTQVDYVGAALGRPSNLEGLGLSKAKLKLDKRGVPCHDRLTTRRRAPGAPCICAATSMPADHDAQGLPGGETARLIIGNGHAMFCPAL